MAARSPGRIASTPGAIAPAQVGDEALLLARAAPTVLARVRPDGARAIEALDVNLIIMDDGFQNPSLEKDLAIIAIDAGAGFGNGLVFPAGPLRAPLDYQRRRAALGVLIGEDGGDVEAGLDGGLPVVEARLCPSEGAEWLRGQRVAAFSGIGRPGKFFATLRDCGANLVAAEAFPDHHAFTDAEALALMSRAHELSAILVTTEKDWVRIGAESGALAELKARSPHFARQAGFPGRGRSVAEGFHQRALEAPNTIIKQMNIFLVIPAKRGPSKPLSCGVLHPRFRGDYGGIVAI